MSASDSGDLPKLPRRRLGRTGLDVAALGLGGASLGCVPGASPDECDAAAVAATRLAIEMGIDYVDTSGGYGESERRIGLALADGWRQRVRLATKVGTRPGIRGDYSGPTIRASLKRSLRDLGTDYLDVVLVHDPPSMEPVFAPGAALDTLEEAKREGVIGAIGLGCRPHAFHRQAVESGRFDLILTFFDYNLLRRSAAPLIATAADRDVGVVLGSSLAAGLLAGNPDELARSRGWKEDSPDFIRARQLYRWAAGRGLDFTALAVQFCLREPRIGVVLTGPRNLAEVEQNTRAAFTPLPPDVWAELAELQDSLGPEPPGGEAHPG